MNIMNWSEYYDGKTIWSPANNPSVLNEKRMSELYPEDLRVMTSAEDTERNGFLYASEVFVMIESKDQGDGSLTTLFRHDMLEEVIKLENFILNLTSPEINDQLEHEQVTFYDLCRKVNVTDEIVEQEAEKACKTNPNFCLAPIEEKCQTTQRPLDFFYDRKTDSYPLDKYKTDHQLIKRIQTGKGDQTFMFYGEKMLYIEIMFAGTIPKEPVQDYVKGNNDLYAAKSARWVYQFENKKIAEGWTRQASVDYELFIQDAISRWGDESQYLQVSCFTRDAWEHSFVANVFEDLKLIGVSMSLVIIYSVFVLGSLNPVLFRSLTALVGCFVVAIALTTGYGIAFAVGLKVSRFHDILPFMIMGIGVDNMFVIVNCVDQEPVHLSAKQRFRKGFQHAGPSITITSITNALAFFVGSLSTLPAIRSLCLFAGIIILTCYFGFLTIFAPFFYQDLRRQHKKLGDCCGVCACSQDTILCCRGRFLTTKQKQFVNLAEPEEDDKKVKDAAETEYASQVEKFLSTVYAEKVLSPPGRFCVLIAWSIFLIVAAYGVSQARTGFSMELFIPVNSYTDKFYQMDMKYFQTGFDMETIVENADIDYASEEAQLTMLDFYDKLEKCYLCSKQWFYRYSLNAWYPQFLAFVDSGLCTEMREGLVGFQKVVPPDKFYPCLAEALELVDDEQKKVLRWKMSESGEEKIIGFKSKIHAHRVPDASKDGIAYLTDIRGLEKEYCFPGTFSYAIQFLDFEMWYTFTSELTLCLSLSIAVILGIILLVTANAYITFMVALCVGIVDMFLFALIYYWGLALNPIVLMHVIVSIGISVDYSAHIGYAYLVESVPNTKEFDTPDKIRVHKAKMALRKMGSAVFHGGFSTFVAIVVLAPGTTYIFVALFRLWFGIVLFGMMNGFLFLPVVLSFIGPTKDVSDPAQHESVELDDKASVNSMRTTTTAGSGLNRNSDEALFSIPDRRNQKTKQQSMDGKEVVDAVEEPPSGRPVLGKMTSLDSVAENSINRD